MFFKIFDIEQPIANRHKHLNTDLYRQKYGQICQTSNRYGTGSLRRLPNNNQPVGDSNWVNSRRVSLTANIKMTILHNFLTKESVPALGFNISTFFLSALIILIILMILVKIRKKSIWDNILKLCFLTLSSMALLFAFFNGITDEYLFSQKDDVRMYMFIATVSLTVYIGEELKALLHSSPNPKPEQPPTPMKDTGYKK